MHRMLIFDFLIFCKVIDKVTYQNMNLAGFNIFVITLERVCILIIEPIKEINIFLKTYLNSS